MSVIVISTSHLIIFNFITVKGVTITIIQKQVTVICDKQISTSIVFCV